MKKETKTVVNKNEVLTDELILILERSIKSHLKLIKVLIEFKENDFSNDSDNKKLTLLTDKVIKKINKYLLRIDSSEEALINFLKDKEDIFKKYASYLFEEDENLEDFLVDIDETVEEKLESEKTDLKENIINALSINVDKDKEELMDEKSDDELLHDSFELYKKNYSERIHPYYNTGKINKNFLKGIKIHHKELNKDAIIKNFSFCNSKKEGIRLFFNVQVLGDIDPKTNKERNTSWYVFKKDANTFNSNLELTNKFFQPYYDLIKSNKPNKISK